MKLDDLTKALRSRSKCTYFSRFSPASWNLVFFFVPNLGRPAVTKNPWTSWLRCPRGLWHGSWPQHLGTALALPWHRPWGSKVTMMGCPDHELVLMLHNLPQCGIWKESLLRDPREKVHESKHETVRTSNGWNPIVDVFLCWKRRLWKRPCTIRYRYHATMPGPSYVFLSPTSTIIHHGYIVSLSTRGNPFRSFTISSPDLHQSLRLTGTKEAVCITAATLQPKEMHMKFGGPADLVIWSLKRALKPPVGNGGS